MNVLTGSSVSGDRVSHLQLGDENASVFALYAIPLSFIDDLGFLCPSALD